MPTPLQSQWHSTLFATLITQEIMLNPLDGETPSSRLRQLGMMNLMFSLYKAESPLTLTTVTELTGMTRTGAQESIDPLVRRGLLIESWGRTSLGRGKKKLYAIAPKLFEKLRDRYGK